MAQQAIGLIETKGLVSLIEASDAALKSANVTIIGWDKVGSGMVTAFFKRRVLSSCGIHSRRQDPNIRMSRLA